MTLDFADLGLRLVGAFYAFAGFLATRAAITSHMLDVALAAISMKPTPLPERLRTLWLVASSLIVLAGGVALVLRIDWAAWLFAASALGQAVYLVALAPLYFDRHDPPDAAGRKGTTNAFVLYLAATALVLWAYARGKLVDWPAAMPAAAIGAAVVALYAMYAAWQLWRPLAARTAAEADDDGDPA